MQKLVSAKAARTRSIPDVLGPGLNVVFCGLNPGLSSAEKGLPFANPTNRFWRVLYEAGFTPLLLNATQNRRLLDYGCGLTAIVRRATVQSSEVAPQEFVAAAGALDRRIRRNSPTHIAFLGKDGYAAIKKTRALSWGLQEDRFAGAHAWVLPNTSGLNRATLNELVAAYVPLRMAAFPSRG